MTVSRCFTNPESVSPHRRRLILSAAESIGYHPNRGASVMRSNKTGRIALIERTPEWDRNWHYDYLFKPIYHGVLKGLAESVFSIVYLEVKNDSELREALKRTPIDGLLGMNFEYPEELATIVESGIPYVVAHNVSHLKGINRCYTNNYRGSFLLGSHLKETGHKQVAYVTHDAAHIQTHAERLQGFRDGIGERNLFKVFDVPFRSKNGGALAGKMILDQIGKGGKIDAVGVLNDETAVGVARALMDGGVRIPEEVSIVGYDHNPIADYLPFQLASVDLNLESVYHSCVTALLRVIRQGGEVHQAIEPILTAGDSVVSRV